MRAHTLPMLLLPCACMPEDSSAPRPGRQPAEAPVVPGSSPDAPEDDPGDTDPPALAVSDLLVDFGVHPVGTEATHTLVLTSESSAELVLSGLELADGTAFSWDHLSASTVPGGTSATVELQFAPLGGEPYADTLTIFSNDPVTPSLAIPLTGAGEAPALQVSPSAADFGTLSIGCEAFVDIELRNAGTAELRIDQLELASATEEMVLELDTESAGELPWTLAPGELQTVQVRYAPLDELADTAVLTVGSTDPGSPSAALTLEGRGELYGENQDLFEQSTTLPTDTFPLSEQPVPSTLTIQLDGSTVTSGWTLHTASNSIVFDASAIPAGGTIVAATYAIAPACD